MGVSLGAVPRPGIDRRIGVVAIVSDDDRRAVGGLARIRGVTVAVPILGSENAFCIARGTLAYDASRGNGRWQLRQAVRVARAALHLARPLALHGHAVDIV